MGAAADQNSYVPGGFSLLVNLMYTYRGVDKNIKITCKNDP